MTAADILDALDLPVAAKVDKRVPKTLLLEHGARTAADRRGIRENVERATWVAALKPTTVGVAAFGGEEREYVEIAVLHVGLRPPAKFRRLADLIHRAIPYPAVAVMDLGSNLHMSLVHKRWSRSETGKTVTEGPVVEVAWPTDGDEAHHEAFLEALALGRQPRETLFSLYQGWIDTVAALHAARRTGRFETERSVEARRDRREALQGLEALEREVTRLRAAASGEKQMAKQVELNLELKRTEAALAAARTKL